MLNIKELQVIHDEILGIIDDNILACKQQLEFISLNLVPGVRANIVMLVGLRSKIEEKLDKIERKINNGGWI